MKIAVLNFSGNVGKSTISQHLLSPRLHDARIISVESINDDGTGQTTVRGKQYGEISEALACLNTVVVDVGSSNVEEFMHRMKQFRGSHEDFDFFVIPTVATLKVQRDTVSTIEALADAGVPQHKIRLVFNMVEHDVDPEREFAGLIDYHKQDQKFALRHGAVIYVSELYARLRESGKSIRSILTDETDYKALLKDADESERPRLGRSLSTLRLAAGVKEELDDVFVELLGS
jgi:hypothetical protein